MFKKNRMGWIIGLLFAAAVAVTYGYKEYNRKPASMATVKADFTFTAASLLAAFERDEAKANQQYLGKVIEVTGPVKSLNTDDKGFYTLALGDEGTLSSVRCSVDSNYAEQAAKVVVGTTVVVRGVCSGFMADELLGSDVTLVRSAILKK